MPLNFVEQLASATADLESAVAAADFERASAHLDLRGELLRELQALGTRPLPPMMVDELQRLHGRTSAIARSIEKARSETRAELDAASSSVAMLDAYLSIPAPSSTLDVRS